MPSLHRLPTLQSLASFQIRPRYSRVSPTFPPAIAHSARQVAAATLPATPASVIPPHQAAPAPSAPATPIAGLTGLSMPPPQEVMSKVRGRRTGQKISQRLTVTERPGITRGPEGCTLDQLSLRATAFETSITVSLHRALKRYGSTAEAIAAAQTIASRVFDHFAQC